MYCTIGGSLNISLSNNPVFRRTFHQSRAVRGHRSAWFPLLSACNLLEFDTSVFGHVLFFLAHLIARYVLSSLNISSGGTKFEIFRERVGYLHFVLLRRARLFDLLLQVMLLVITGVICAIFVRLRQR